MKVWLAHRSLTTLSVRLERHCFNAQAIAEYLAARTEVLSVRYPGSPTDPTHAIAEQQIKLFGSVVSFVLPDQSQAERFLQSCELVYEATSFGVIHTTTERSARGVAINLGWIYSLECKL